LRDENRDGVIGFSLVTSDRETDVASAQHSTACVPSV